MTPAEAKRLAPKDIVIGKHTVPPEAPQRVREVWVSANEQHARLLLVGKRDWVDVALYELPPAGYVWDKMRGWHPPTP